MANTSALKQAADKAQEIDQYLTFILSDEHFAVPIMHMKEILEYGDITYIPMVPDFIRGVINLRGSVVPVIDLASMFGMEVHEVTRRTCIVIMELELDGEPAVMGIVVDKVLQVQDIAGQNVEPPPAFGTKIRTNFIKGMGRLDDRFVIILDVDQVLSADEIAIVSQLQGDDHSNGSSPDDDRA